MCRAIYLNRLRQEGKENTGLMPADSCQPSRQIGILYGEATNNPDCTDLGMILYEFSLQIVKLRNAAKLTQRI
jgi:hypothetical protein